MVQALITLRYSLGIGLIITLLTACGFQLRGNVAVPERFQTLSLQANPNNDFTAALVEQLKANSIQVNASAPVQLVIHHDDQEVRTVSYSSRSKSAEKEIIQEVQFSVKDRRKNTTIIPKTDLQVRRAFLYDDTKIAAMREQQALIKEELSFELAGRLLRQLQKQ